MVAGQDKTITRPSGCVRPGGHDLIIRRLCPFYSFLLLFSLLKGKEVHEIT